MQQLAPVSGVILPVSDISYVIVAPEGVECIKAEPVPEVELTVECGSVEPSFLQPKRKMNTKPANGNYTLRKRFLR
ncbi:MAG: hypothetical protein M0R68_11395 [Bacteroidetes bacterium]|nr:hypothetical protein [Bacteroidota bacterium]